MFLCAISFVAQRVQFHLVFKYIKTLHHIVAIICLSVWTGISLHLTDKALQFTVPCCRLKASKISFQSFPLRIWTEQLSFGYLPLWILRQFKNCLKNLFCKHYFQLNLSLILLNSCEKQIEVIRTQRSADMEGWLINAIV